MFGKSHPKTVISPNTILKSDRFFSIVTADVHRSPDQDDSLAKPQDEPKPSGSGKPSGEDMAQP